MTPADRAPVFLSADCGPRYWEDATVDGIPDEDGSRIPCRFGHRWRPVIELRSGRIEGWPDGRQARLHYKVCDDGAYALLDAAREAIVEIEGYVPSIMCPGRDGFGDYVKMTIDGTGRIDGWHPDLSDFWRDRLPD